ncbi:YfbM family protein [Rhizohabitans arisaemae]|uniref:YfbM family protein n=1 Tax=Rhizohabitans arisaemae TaxID=2720610 RepID=UPI0024B103A0|nr:YfbM family protein [Rhizohabitans arisaemae]
MNGNYLRVTTAQLAQAIGDPEWAVGFAEAVMDAEDDVQRRPFDARYLTTHKAWHAIGFLLEQVGFPVDIVYGEQTFTDEDWGYEPPKYLDAEQVQLAADALAKISFNDLVEDTDPADLTRAEIYPQMWDEPDALVWVQSWFQPIVPFFKAAARYGEAIIVWID